MKSFVGLLIIVCGLISSGCGKNLTEKDLIERAKQLQDKGDLRASIIELKNALVKDPNNAEARWLLGQIYVKAGLGEAGEKELRKAQELGVDAESTKIPIGEALLLQNEFQKVLDQIQPSATTTTQNRAKILRLYGDAKLGLGQLNDGCALYQQSTSLYANYAPAYWGLARCAMAKKDLAGAKQQIDTALKVDQTNPDTWVLLGDFDQYNNNLTASETDYSNALKFAPNHEGALLHRALTYLLQHKFDQAQADLTSLQKFMPNHPLTLFLQATLQYGKGNYRASLDSLQQVFKYQPDFMPAVRLAGIVQYNLGSYEQSATNLSRYFGHYPGDLQVRKLLAAVFVILGQGDEALKLLKPVLDSGKKDDYELLALTGEAYLKNKKPAAAAEQFEKAAAIDPKNVGLHTQLGLSLLSAGETAQGTAEFETAARLDSKQYKADYALVLIYLQQRQFDKALEVLTELEKKQPDNAGVFNLRGGAYIGKNDLVEARKNFERALAIDPASVAAATNLAQLDLREKNPMAARKRFEGILAKDKNNLRAMLAMASIANFEGNEQEYLDWLGKAAKSNPTAVEPHVFEARYYLERNQPQKALNYAREALNAQPDNPAALEVMGDVQSVLGDRDSALVSFTHLTQVTPNSAENYFKLASIEAAMGKLAESRKGLERALELNPDYAEAQAALVALEVSQGKQSDALRMARQVQQHRPKSALGFTFEGDVLMSQKLYPQAAKAYESAWGREQSGLLAVKRFEAYNQAGKRKNGEATILQWLQKQPEDRTARLYLAQFYMQAGENGSAIAQYQALVQHEPNNALALNNLAWLYFKQKDPKALDYAEQAYKLHPDAATILDTLGWINADRGNLARGLDFLKKAVSLAPKNPEIKYHYAALLARSGDKTNARKQLEELFAWKQRFSQQDEAKALLDKL